MNSSHTPQDGESRRKGTTSQHFAAQTVHDASKLARTSGALRWGQGLIATILALVLAFLCLLGVLAFHFPQYLTTPELRHVYSVDTMRTLLFAALIVSGGLALASIVLGNRRRLNGLAFVLVLAAVTLGGSRVSVGDFPDHTPYIGLDWFILDLLGSTTIFILLEKAFPLYRNQPVFRAEWQTDMAHFAVNHFIVGLVLLVVNFLIHHVFGWMVNAEFQQMVQHIWFLPQLLLCMLVADLMEYVTHRAYHEVPFLWRFHAVHHSVKTMDWLAGSRQHILELVVTRVAVLGPLFALGFDKTVVDLYIIIVGFQAVFNHANVHLPWGPLRYIFVTPDFHHWHHSSEDEAIDKNYAAHFSFIDYIFGTTVKSKRAFPEKYGVVGDYVPDGFIKQQRFPFRRDNTRTDVAQS
ncbi:sterol desaturase family protein [Burkholderia sp. BE17]|uniref:sterol desaturase family protein n=1 Tax=Burkholderia sp. BE17 TaxID=2656644 RepID=UPI00128B4DF6|nr:sterol desaturase family protein [Burkholderia sp. BE17]MPV71373.1 sterol desaturase family protein [Burkholderia sp. BE17]